MQFVVIKCQKIIVGEAGERKKIVRGLAGFFARVRVRFVENFLGLEVHFPA